MPADRSRPGGAGRPAGAEHGRIRVGVAVIFAVIAVLQWLSNDDLWVPVLHALPAVAYAGTARGSLATDPRGGRAVGPGGCRAHSARS